MNTAPTGNAGEPAVSGGMSNDLATLGLMTIGRKIAGIVAVAVSIGIGVMTWLSATVQEGDFRMMSEESGVTITKMLQVEHN